MTSVRSRFLHAAGTVVLAFSLAVLVNAPQCAEIAPGGRIEVAFSPNEGAEELVVRVIESARSQIAMLAYTYTSSTVTRALLRARSRGVAVRLVVDHRANFKDDRTGRPALELSALARAGCDVRVISAYLAAHDKILIADGRTTELGSFNYSVAAARRNSENALVVWDNPDLARAYLQHFERNYRQSAAFE